MNNVDVQNGLAETETGSVCIMGPTGESNSNPLLLLPVTTLECDTDFPSKRRAAKCANCCSKFPKTSEFPGQVVCIGEYAVEVNGPTRTIFQGLQLLFKSRQCVPLMEINSEQKDIQFCIPCASQFHILMTSYATFLESSRAGSYVSNLQKEVAEHFKQNPQILKEIKPRTLRRRAPTRTSPSRAVFTWAAPIPPEVQASDIDLLCHESEIITSDCIQDDYTAINNEEEDTEMSLDVSGSTLQDPLSMPSTSTRINEDLDFKPITFDFGPSIIAIPNIRPVRARKQKLPAESDNVPRRSRRRKSDTLPKISSPLPNLSNPSEQSELKPSLGHESPTTAVTAVSPEPVPPRTSPHLHPPDATRHFECFDCNAGFTTPRQLRRHSRVYHAAPLLGHQNRRKKKIELTEEEMAMVDFSKFKCDGFGCEDVVFGSFKEWVLHQENDHKLDTGYKDYMEKPGELVPRDRKMRPCPICGRKCDSGTRIKTHLKSVHFKSEEVVCEVCGRIFATKASLEQHLKILHSETPVKREFLCTYCGASFGSKGGLTAHESCHLDLIKTKEKKFACDLCEKRFELKSHLRKHKFSHSEERNFACDQCDATFKSQHVRNAHKKRIHYKRFILDEVCDLCGKKYAFKERLKEHLISHHKMTKDEARIAAKQRRPTLSRVLPNGDRIFKEKPTKPKTCYICNRTYVRRDTLFTHLMSVHGKSEEEAKNITGLESKRNLVPTVNSRRRNKAKSSSKNSTTSGSESEREHDDDDEEDVEDEKE